MIKFYEAQYKHFYSSIPNDITQKYKTTIAKVDEMVLDNKLTGGLSSKSADFDLDYYAQTIKVGVIPYLDQNDPLRKRVQQLADDIDIYTLDRKKLVEHNREVYGDKIPEPTTSDNSPSAWAINH